MIKKFNILLAAAALLGLLSCNREDIISDTSADTSAISFGTVETKAVDKASDIEEFSVWATVSSIGSTDVSYQPLLTNERVYRNPAGSENWTYDNTEHWISNSMFYFFAAYPYNVGFQQQTMTQNGVNYTSYALEVTADGSEDTTDILTAFSSINTNDASFNSDAPVNLNFAHLLTKFNLKVSQNFDVDNEFDYYVTKVTITGVKSNGRYLFMPYQNNDTNYMFYWDMQDSTPITIIKTFDSPVSLRNKGAADPKVVLSVWGSNGLMLIPQDIATDGVEVVVDYIYDVTVDDNDYSDGTAKTAKAYIPATTWESGKAISYSIALSDKTNITFSQPTIEPWGAPQTGGTIIIK